MTDWSSRDGWNVARDETDDFIAATANNCPWFRRCTHLLFLFSYVSQNHPSSACLLLSLFEVLYIYADLIIDGHSRSSRIRHTSLYPSTRHTVWISIAESFCRGHLIYDFPCIISSIIFRSSSHATQRTLPISSLLPPTWKLFWIGIIRTKTQTWLPKIGSQFTYHLNAKAGILQIGWPDNLRA